MPLSLSLPLLRRNTLLSRIVPTALLCTLPLSAAAQSAAYPDRPVTVVVPFSAGGDADLAARNLGAAAQKLIGQTLVPQNKAGASGAIGSLAVRHAKPDGYTLLLARVGSQVVLPALQNPAAYKYNDFSFLGLLELNPVVCAVRQDSGLRTMKDLVDALRNRPGKLNYSTTGAATILNFGPQLLFDQLGLGKDAAQAITYKGGGEAAMALLAGDVDFSCGNLTSMIGNLQAGKLRALMVTTPERVKDLPDVPTARETGYPQMEAIIGWSALYGPPGLPKDVVDRWSAALAQVAKDPAWISATEKAGSIPRVLGPAATEQYAAEQFQVYQRLGAKLQIELK